MGVPQAAMKRLASLLAGIRIATVSNPPVALSGTVGFFGNTTVILPGIKASIIFFASGGTDDASNKTSFLSAIWAMRGLSCGLPLATKIFAIASSLNTLAPNPYTVSVGKATSCPALTSLFAFFKLKKFNFFTKVSI